MAVQMRARHRTTIRRSEWDDPDQGWTWRYAATCSCRWVGRMRPGRDAAAADAEEHQRSVPTYTQPELFGAEEVAS